MVETTSQPSVSNYGCYLAFASDKCKVSVLMSTAGHLYLSMMSWVTSDNDRHYMDDTLRGTRHSLGTIGNQFKHVIVSTQVADAIGLYVKNHGYAGMDLIEYLDRIFP